jgi:hypothetical protein
MSGKLSGSGDGASMGRFLPLLQRTLFLPTSLVSLCLGAVVHGQPTSLPGRVPTRQVERRETAGPAPTGASATDARVERYKVQLLSWSGPPFESWIVFDVIGGTTIILLKHATTNTAKWWDHPILSSKACRIILADGGDRLVDCLRVVSGSPGQPLRIVLPEGTSLHDYDYLLTFTWQESGKIQEGVIRIDRTLKPDVIKQGQDVITPFRVEEPPSNPRGWRYKVKLSQGVALQNLAPESWVVFDVNRGTTVTLRHTTNSVNILTGLSRWWDHPVLSSMACPLIPSEGSYPLAGCLRGSSAGLGQPLRIVLPEGASLHDYRFTFTWREHGRIQQGMTIVDRLLKPTPIPPR